MLNCAHISPRSKCFSALEDPPAAWPRARGISRGLATPLVASRALPRVGGAASATRPPRSRPPSWPPSPPSSTPRCCCITRTVGLPPRLSPALSSLSSGCYCGAAPVARWPRPRRGCQHPLRALLAGAAAACTWDTPPRRRSWVRRHAVLLLPAVRGWDCGQRLPSSSPLLPPAACGYRLPSAAVGQVPVARALPPAACCCPPSTCRYRRHPSATWPLPLGEESPLRHNTGGHPRVPVGRRASLPPFVTSPPLRRQGRGMGGGPWRRRQRRIRVARAGDAPEQRAADVGWRRQASC